MIAPPAPRTPYLKLVVSGARQSSIDIYSKIGGWLQCERAYGQNRRGVVRHFPGQGLPRR